MHARANRCSRLLGGCADLTTSHGANCRRREKLPPHDLGMRFGLGRVDSHPLTDRAPAPAIELRIVNNTVAANEMGVLMSAESVTLENNIFFGNADRDLDGAPFEGATGHVAHNLMI